MDEDEFLGRNSKDYEFPEMPVKETNFEIDTIFKDNNISLTGCFPGLQTDHESVQTFGATRDEAGFDPGFVDEDKVQESSGNSKQQKKSSENAEINNKRRIILEEAEEMLTEHELRTENETEIIESDGVRPGLYFIIFFKFNFNTFNNTYYKGFVR